MRRKVNGSWVHLGELREKPNTALVVGGKTHPVNYVSFSYEHGCLVSATITVLGSDIEEHLLGLHQYCKLYVRGKCWKGLATLKSTDVSPSIITSEIRLTDLSYILEEPEEPIEEEGRNLII